MRVVLTIAALIVGLVAAVAVIEPLLDDPAPQRAEPDPAPRISGPFGLAERGADSPVAELTRRLEADAFVPGPPQRAAGMSDAALARRIVDSTCRGSNRDCRQAVASAAIRDIWASMPRRADPARKAQRLLAFAARFSLTPIEVRNSIRAELDEQLTRAVGRGRIGERRREAAIDCFDAPAKCRLRLRDIGRPKA